MKVKPKQVTDKDTLSNQTQRTLTVFSPELSQEQRDIFNMLLNKYGSIRAYTYLENCGKLNKVRKITSR